MSNGVAQFAASPDVAQPDPSKHVNYTLGMLLGVDDFQAEFAYLSGRDQWMARDLVGYGTVCGLKVSLDSSGTGPRVSVSSGTALSPRGQMICVHPAQCAYLKDWFNANQNQVNPQGGSPLGSIQTLWLVLCYRDCLVDPVPIAGEPCRSADELSAPSRVVDDFRLELRVAAPLQEEEDAIRDFVAWLDQIQITDVGPANTFLNITDFGNALRAALVPSASPLDPGAYFHLGSPLNQVRVHLADVGKYLREAFRIWVTEIRPIFHGCWPQQSCTCSDDAAALKAPPTDECLLLAEVDVPVVSSSGKWVVDDKHPITIDESRRPILLHTRMLQEWMLSGLRGGK